MDVVTLAMVIVISIGYAHTLNFLLKDEMRFYTVSAIGGIAGTFTAFYTDSIVYGLGAAFAATALLMSLAEEVR